MRRTLVRIYWLAAGFGAAACGGATGDQLFGPGGGGNGTSGSGGSQAPRGGTGGNAGAQSEGGASLGGGAGQAATGGSAGTSNVSGGSSGNAGGVSGGTAGKGGASGAAGSAAAGAGGSAGRGGAGGSAGAAGKGGAGGSAGAVATGGVSSAGAGGQAMCDAMRAELSKLLTAAQVCDISLDRGACTGFVSNECGCKVPVDAPSLAAAQSYVTAVAAVIKCGGVACPAIACAEPVAAHCQTEGAAAKGHCVVGAAQ